MFIARSAAFAVAVSALFSPGTAQIRFDRSGELTRVLAADGVVAHETSAAVTRARTIELAASSVSLALWNEGAQSFTAISLDGRSIARLAPTTYELGFRRATFDPLRELPSFAGSPLRESDELYVVQYVTQPLVEYSDALIAAGARVYDYVQSHAHIVRMDAVTRAKVAALPFVRWVGSYHPEFRVEPEVLAELRGGVLGTQRFNVMCFERGLQQQELVVAYARALGAEVHALTPEGFRMELTLSPEQLAAVAALDEVQYVDRWAAPSDDMDVVRAISGADHVEAAPGNFAGQGVRGEVCDSGADLSHVDIRDEEPHGSVSGGEHGTCTSGIVFGRGIGNPAARGLLPQGTLIAGDYGSFSGGNRYTHTAELVDPSRVYKCVFQSNSWGTGLTTSYGTISAELDDIVLLNDLTLFQSQSNTGSTLSRPQAWSKNVISVGGINHYDTLSTSDDDWNGASIGPAQDGRIKPDLAHFYDSVLTTDVPGGSGYSNGDYHAQFGGTSAATPITAGHGGLFFQMWHAGAFGNTPGGPTVFASRPHFALAKAALINTATQWSFSGAATNLTRTHQGWGRADVKTLYDLRAKTFFINQTDTVVNLSSVLYQLDVAAGEPALRVTLVYRDAKGAVSTTQHRKNDLTLRAVAPGGAVYWGNSGLHGGLWSTTGGAPDNKNTVENVFVQNPTVGTWTIEVRGDDVNTDPVSGAPSGSTDFALWVTGVTLPCSTPVTYCTAQVTSSATVPRIWAAGSPSVAGNNFAVTLADALPNKSCILFYGDARNATPFLGGTLCVSTPITRTPPLGSTDGAGAAQHNVPLDLSMVGVTRCYQWWFRDPLAASTTGLSDGLEVSFCD